MGDAELTLPDLWEPAFEPQRQNIPLALPGNQIRSDNFVTRLAFT